MMLFHQLSNDALTYDFLTDFEHEPFSLQVTGLMNLGAGVAYLVESPQLNSLHQQLKKHFKDVLIPQDRQYFRPHITIMNKRTPEAARVLLAQLENHFNR